MERVLVDGFGQFVEDVFEVSGYVCSPFL